MSTQIQNYFCFLRDHSFRNKHEFHWHWPLCYMRPSQNILYKSGDNQNWHHVHEWWGEKKQIDCSLQRGFSCRGQSLCAGLAVLPHRAPLTLVMRIDTGNPEYHNLQHPTPWGNHAPQAGALTYTTPPVHNFHSSALQLVPPQGAELRYLRVAWMLFQVFCFIFKSHENVAMQIQNQHFNTQKYSPPTPKVLQGK